MKDKNIIKTTPIEKRKPYAKYYISPAGYEVEEIDLTPFPKDEKTRAVVLPKEIFDYILEDWDW